MLSARNILIFLNKKNNGNWDKMYHDIQNRANYPEDDVDITQYHHVTTLVDPDYPTKLKQSFKPPFCLFWEGDLSLLNKDNIMVICGSDKGNSELAKLISELSDSHIVINGDDSAIEREALQIVMKNNQPLILVLNEAIDESDLDDEVFLYAVNHGCVISEYGFTSPEIDETQLAKTRIIAFLSDKALITSSKKNNTRLCLLIDHLLGAGKELFVMPEKGLCGSLNNELIRDGAILVNKKEDIF